ncbi:MAG: FAD-binding domain-containing protein [Chloroflexota bacterium]
MSQDMRRDFENRADLIEYLKDEFPKAYATDPSVSDEFIGGRAEAEKRLQQVKPGSAYKRTRNYLDGAVSRLSPYIRYGILSLAEVRDYALAEAGNGAGKFVNELGWRDFWQRLYAKMGDDIWQDQENYKTGFLPHEYADELPEDIAKGETGVALIDDIVNELRTTGYLHNRQRMYFAAYVVHWRNVKWQAGARFFLTHLLDGDPASNNLSWQWVSSTFSHKPYIFNLSNARKFTGKKYEAPAHETGMEVFEGSYEQINKDLFRVKVT